MDWKKIFLVVKREYLTRIRTKIFVLSTLLIPVGLVGYILLVYSLQFMGSEPDQTIGIHDSTGSIAERLVERDPGRYHDLSSDPVEALPMSVQEGELDGYVLLREEHISGDEVPEFIYGGNSTLSLQSSLRYDLSQVIREERLFRSGVTQDIQEIFESEISMESRRLTESGETEEDDTLLYTGIGFFMSFAIFFALIMYGTIIMKGVLEEKTSRIVEVIISSVRPLDLLTGKILGITGVAITQFLFWILLSLLIVFALAPILMMFGGGVDMDTAALAEAADAAGGSGATALAIPSINPWLVAAFFLYFVLGYFLYSALFAVVGSSVDSESDTQQMVMPIMFLIVIAWIINLQVIQNPSGTISVLASLFPFFAPVNMVTRLAVSQVPAWQLVLSLLLMTGAIAGTMLLSARIYKAGILQYGKKARFRDLFKWVRQR